MLIITWPLDVAERTCLSLRWWPNCNCIKQ